MQLIPAWIDNVQRVTPNGEVLPVPILCTPTFGAPVQRQAGEDKRSGTGVLSLGALLLSVKECLRWKNLSSNLDKFWYFSNNDIYAGHYSAAR